MEHPYSRSAYMPPLLSKTPTSIPRLPEARTMHTTEFNVEPTKHLASSSQVTLPPLSSYALPWPEPPSEFRDLSEISRAKLDLPEDEGFELSHHLKTILRRPTAATDVDEILHHVYSEARRYAEDRKELVRNELKKRLREVRGTLTAREKGKLRSRREAKVHRVKEQHLEKALRKTIRWLITEASSPRTCAGCSSSSP